MLPPSSSANQDKSKDWQLELLMEKLRSKTVQFKTFTETSKNVRMAMLVSFIVYVPVFDKLDNFVCYCIL